MSGTSTLVAPRAKVSVKLLDAMLQEVFVDSGASCLR